MPINSITTSQRGIPRASEILRIISLPSSSMTASCSSFSKLVVKLASCAMFVPTSLISNPLTFPATSAANLMSFASKYVGRNAASADSRQLCPKCKKNTVNDFGNWTRYSRASINLQFDLFALEHFTILKPDVQQAVQKASMPFQSPHFAFYKDSALDISTSQCNLPLICYSKKYDLFV